MLNSNETISKNGGVIFIYALRDDLFLNSEDRVKFFDNIIPVVSKFSSQNAKQYIMELYRKIQNKYELTIFYMFFLKNEVINVGNFINVLMS